MKISKVHIRHYGILKDINLFPNSIMALVGDNNSGKSTVFKAIELFFENSTRLVTKDIFHDNDVTKPIEIEVEFTNLSHWEKEELSAWLNGDNLTVKRIISLDEAGNPKIDTYAKTIEPKLPWLKSDEVNSSNIKEWIKDIDGLKVSGKSFKNYLEDGKTTVASWEKAIHRFIDENKRVIEFEEIEKENPKGYPNVLKGTLPEFIVIPAVRDISDETKTASTTSFGKLVDRLVKSIPNEAISDINSHINSVKGKLNRSADDTNRLAQIKILEDKLNTFMQEIMDCELELEFEVPTIKDVLGKVKIFARDGVRTPIYMKGHGLQRSAIFTILRAYAELKNIEQNNPEQERLRTTIFAFEEPELYLHPQLQRTLYKTLYKLAEYGDQIMYSTHSSLFVNIERFDDICILKKVENSSSCESEPTQLEMKTMLEDLLVRKGITGSAEGIRGHYANIFNTEISEGFFASKVLIVEGASEKNILPVYYQGIGGDVDRENIAIVHAFGKGPIDRLIRVFSGFGIPTYTWFDGDKSNIDPDIKNKTLELMKIHGNIITTITELKTEVLQNFAVLENTLEELLSDEIFNFKELEKLAKEELGPDIGKPLIHKYMAVQILKKIKEGANPADTIPPTILAICNKLRELNTVTPILQRNDS